MPGVVPYDVYGWFKFESDADGVQRLDRQWVPLHDLEQAEGWKAAVLKLEEKLKNASSALTAGRTSGVRQSHRVACVGCSNCAGTGSNQSRGTSQNRTVSPLLTPRGPAVF
jgi:hypothetical protein